MTPEGIEKGDIVQVKGYLSEFYVGKQFMVTEIKKTKSSPSGWFVWIEGRKGPFGSGWFEIVKKHSDVTIADLNQNPEKTEL